MEMSGQLHALAALIQGRSPLYVLNKRLIGPKSGRESLIFLLKQISVSIFDTYCKIQTNFSLISGVFVLFYICTYMDQV